MSTAPHASLCQAWEDQPFINSSDFIIMCQELQWFMTHPRHIAPTAMETLRELSEGYEEGIAPTLVQCGLSVEWWEEAMDFDCQLRKSCDTIWGSHRLQTYHSRRRTTWTTPHTER